MNNYRKLFVRLGKLLIIALIVDFCIQGYKDISYFNTHTGQVRNCRYFGHVLFYMKTEDSDYSKMLNDYGYSFKEGGIWKPYYSYRFTVLDTIHPCFRSYCFYGASEQLVKEIQFRIENKTITKDAVVQLLAYNIYLMEYPTSSDEWNIYKHMNCLSDKVQLFPYRRVIEKDSISPPAGYSKERLVFVNFP